MFIIEIPFQIFKAMCIDKQAFEYFTHPKVETLVKSKMSVTQFEFEMCLNKRPSQ